MATSEKVMVDNPRWYRSAQAKLRIMQRGISRRKIGGTNRRKAVLALQRQHDHIANSRKDFLNKLTHSLIVSYDQIVLEDLHISGMVHNHHLLKSILDAGWRYLKQRLADKTAEVGRQIILVNPAYTSKTCSACGEHFPDLSLADRWVECSCGLSIDRDVNAALNILRVGRKYRRWSKAGPGSPATLVAGECHSKTAAD